jgi:methenyltetrahydrofolate cyclohydrolase
MMRKPSRRKLSTCSSLTTALPYSRVTDLGKAQLETVLEAVAQATPAPGGGTSAAITAALAAALVEMAARLGSADEAAEQASALRAQALRLAEEELTSYGPVLEARTPADRTTALDAASEPPAQIAEAAADVAELGIEVGGASSPAVRGDALTGVVLAEAAASAAARLVEINVGSGPVFERAQQAEQRALKARESAPRPAD